MGESEYWFDMMQKRLLGLKKRTGYILMMSNEQSINLRGFLNEHLLGHFEEVIKVLRRGRASERKSELKEYYEKITQILCSKYKDGNRSLCLLEIIDNKTLLEGILSSDQH